MAWSWSHTAEAYENARENVSKQSDEWLAVCLAEWLASSPNSVGHDFNSEQYDRVLPKVKAMAHDMIVANIQERMAEYATCDNGGFNAWACPFGCHKVSFDCEEIA